MEQQLDLAPVEEILKAYPARESSLIMVLQDVQGVYRYLPRSAIDRVARALEVPRSRVYQVATFYRSFSLEPRGEHEIKVCLGTACHIRGASLTVEGFERAVGCRAGHTSEDGRFTLETVNCVGACALAPVVVVDEKVHAGVTVNRVDRILKAYK